MARRCRAASYNTTAPAVETLSERQRNIFLLRFVEELELPEIAEAMQLNLNTVKSHLYRALSAVKQQVGEAR